MKKKKQKTYQTSQDIVRDIDLTIKKSNDLFADADTKEELGHRLIRTGVEADLQEGQWQLKKAGIARRKAERCQSKLDRLKQTLSSMKTETMPFLDNRQVVLQ